jgi:hypothetical protein
MALAAARHRYAILALLTLLYGIGAMRYAASKPLWYDEVVTVIVARAPDAATTWKLAQQTDASPPLPHLLTHFAMRWFGGGDVAVRLPAIAGFWIFCLCLFWFVRRRLGIFYGLAALLLPLATEAYDYAYEARAYGLELAFCGLMLVAWQAATCSRWPQERFRHATACAVLCLSLMGALMCHYYAVMLYVPLAGGEAYRCWKARRIHWGIWTAFALGAAPLVWRVAAIRDAVRGFSQTTWSPPHLVQVLEFWEDGLQPISSILVLALAVTALWAWKSPDSSAPPDNPPAFPLHELLAGILFLGIPLFVMVAGMLVTHMFIPRYALLGLTGVVLLTPAVVARLARGRALPAFLLLALAVLRLIVVTGTIPPPANPLAGESVLLKALEQGPVVVAEGQTFMQVWYYTPEPLKSNLVFLVDSTASVKYGFFNTASIDAAMAYLRHWYPFRVIDYRDFATPGKDFRVLQNPLKPGWLLAKVAADGGAETVEQYTNLRQLYRVRMPK